jgi:murein endopeptidase
VRLAVQANELTRLVLRRAVAVLAIVTLAAAAPEVAYSQPAPPPCHSRALGKPWHGRLQCGVQLPAESDTFTTWDFPLHRAPNDDWRRWGTEELVAVTEQIAADYRARFGPGPRLVIGDLSRPRGGPFGREFGGLGHASHQNGRDVDIFYPRRDGLEQAPDRPSQVDRVRAQWLVDRAARDAERVFIGPHVHLRRKFKRVQYLPFHDDHLHLRIPQPPPVPVPPPTPGP